MKFLKMKQKWIEQKKSEFGRSMVEILGVLSVIGVLSIGALQGYSYAIDKYVANEIAYEVGLRGADIFSSYQSIDLPVVESDSDELVHAFEHWDTTLKTGHTAIITSHPEFDGFKIWVDNVQQSVCEKILNMELLENNSIVGLQMIKVTGQQFKNGVSCPLEAAQMEFVFLLDSEAYMEGEDNCLTNDDCQSQCKGQMYCDREGGYVCGCPKSVNGAPQVCNPSTNMCEEVRKCEVGSEFRAASGVCIPGGSSGSYKILAGTEPYKFIDADGNHVSDDLSPAELCARSHEQRWTNVSEANQNPKNPKCFIGCPSGEGYVPDIGISKGYVVWKDDAEANAQFNNSCIQCDLNYDFAPKDKADCAKCGLETYTTQIYPSSTICSHPCEEGELKVSGAYAAGFGKHGYKCVKKPSDRKDYGIPKEQKYKDICTKEWGWLNLLKGQWCVKPCATGQFMKAPIWGANWATASACYSCGDPYPREIGSKNQMANDEYNALVKQCTDCGRTVEETTEGITICKPNSDPCGENQFLNSENKCVDCDSKTTHVIAGTGSGCEDKCKKTVVNADGTTSQVSTRWIVRETAWNKYKCMKKCDDNQFQGWNGTCYDCDKSGSVQITDTSMSQQIQQLKDLCTACKIKDGEVEKQRILFSRAETYCILEECGEGEVMNRKGQCIACNDSATKIGLDRSRDGSDCNNCPYYSEINQGRSFFTSDDVCVTVNPGSSGSCNSLGDALNRHTYPEGDGQTFLSYQDGLCYPCDHTAGVVSTLKQCETCPNRQYIGGTCYPFVGCTESETFWNSEKQGCEKCSTGTIKVQTKAVDRGLCDGCFDSEGKQNRRSMTAVDEEGYLVVYCVQRCNENQWQDVDGHCLSKNDLLTLSERKEIGTDSNSRALCAKLDGVVSDEIDEQGITRVYCSSK